MYRIGNIYIIFFQQKRICYGLLSLRNFKVLPKHGMDRHVIQKIDLAEAVHVLLNAVVKDAF